MTVSIIGITATRSLASAAPPAARSEATTGPQLRAPDGGYRAARTTASASSALLTIGTMTPSAPASRTLPMTPGSFHGTRAIGLDPLATIAWNSPTASW